MTDKVRVPQTADQCSNPWCSVSAREKDRGFIPQFCSDSCQERFVAEYDVCINPATVRARIHPDLRGAAVSSGLVPVGQVIVAAKPETFRFEPLKLWP